MILKSPLPTPHTAASGSATSLFARAARVFDGWNDPETGLRVLRIADKDTPIAPGVRTAFSWRTLYHQYPCFLDGGKKIVLRIGEEIPHPRTADSRLLDLTTGQVSDPFPPGYFPMMVWDATNLALLCKKDWRACDVVLWDLKAEKALNTLSHDDWLWGWCHFTCDGHHAVVGQIQATDYFHPAQSRHFLLGDDGSRRLILEDDGAICNHILCSPTDPNLYAYDRWPAPYTHTPQVIRLRAMDGNYDEPLALLPGTLRPGHILGGQRDHYVWTPDGSAIASYVTPLESTDGKRDHFDFGWHASVTNWKTGEDLCAEYPPLRWGCHFSVTPDSRWIVSCGGRGFDKLYAVEISRLKQGWNERVLCSYPRTEHDGTNKDLFPQPWPLPDQSGVIFTAGWHGAESGVYLCEWAR